MMKQILGATLLLAGLVPASQATVLELENNGEGEIIFDTKTSLSGNLVLTMEIDTYNTSHGALNFSRLDGVGLINCNLSGSTFTANGFTCHYNASNILVGLSPAPFAFKVKSTGTSDEVKVSFGLKAQ